MNPDCPIVQGVRSRYACRTVAEVDAHLAGLTSWLARVTPGMMHPARVVARQNYARDVDRLLNARVMIAAFETMDEDLADLSVGIMRERDLVL